MVATGADNAPDAPRIHRSAAREGAAPTVALIRTLPRVTPPYEPSVFRPPSLAAMENVELIVAMTASSFGSWCLPATGIIGGVHQPHRDAQIDDASSRQVN
jgi:hypothetical protein